MEPDSKNQTLLQPVSILFGVECFGGGVLKHLVYLLSNLDQNQFDIHLITSSFRTSSEAHTALKHLQKIGVKIELLPIQHSFNLWSDARCIRQIVQYVRQHNISIVHAHSSKAGLLFRMAGPLSNIKTIYTPHCYYFLAHRGLKRWFFLGIERLMGYITHITILAENEKMIACKNRVIQPSKIRVINNAIDPVLYPSHQRNAALRQLHLPELDFIVGGVGRLCKQKNWEIFVRIAADVIRSHPEVTFVIAGDGEDRDRLQALIDELDIATKFHLLGHLDDISVFYSCLDLFVSTSCWEGLPYTYLEAAHYRIPIFFPRMLQMHPLFICSEDCPSPMHEKIAFALSNLAERTLMLSTIPDVPLFTSFLNNHAVIYHSLYR